MIYFRVMRAQVALLDLEKKSPGHVGTKQKNSMLFCRGLGGWLLTTSKDSRAGSFLRIVEKIFV